MLLLRKLIIMFIVFFPLVSYEYSAWQDDTVNSVHEKFIAKIKDKRTLNILFVVNYFPVLSQTFILNIVKGLIDKGHKVSIFSFHRENYVHLHPIIEKYKLLNCVMYEKFPERLPKCDIVFCQFGSLGKRIVEMPKLSEWLKTKKVVTCFRGFDTTAFVQKDPTVYKKLFKRGDLFLPVCDYFRKRLIGLGCQQDKIVVHHSAIDCSQFFFTKREKPKSNKIKLISVCRLVKKKGIDYAVAAIAEVVKQYPQVHYSIVGDGSERTYLESLIQQLKLQDHVTLHGWKTRDEVITLLNESHIFLLPSITSADGDEEGIANALKEAMAMGLISVGTIHAGTPELIEHGVSGFLVPERNSSELASTIGYIIENPDEWLSIELAARKKVEDEFETTQSIEKLEQLFYKLLGR